MLCHVPSINVLMRQVPLTLKCLITAVFIYLHFFQNILKKSLPKVNILVYDTVTTQIHQTILIPMGPSSHQISFNPMLR